MRAATFVLLMLFSITASATIYKCPTASGKIEYSSRPCADGEMLEIKRSAGLSSPESMRMQPGGGQIEVGMTTDQVRAIWGEPESVTTRSGADGMEESWWYSKNDRRHLFLIKKGKVSSMSNHEPFGSRSTSEPEAPVYKREPTIREREEQEREEKAGSRRYISQGMSQTRVRSDLGEPENKSFRAGLECWNYSPAPKDRQARTSVCFDRSGNVLTVDRTIER
jgi:hypothetical protein